MKKLLTLLIIVNIFIACNGFYSGTPGIPQNLTATSGESSEADRITLSWNIVEDAGVYMIYRSLTEIVDHRHYEEVFRQLLSTPHHRIISAKPTCLQVRKYEPGLDGWTHSRLTSLPRKNYCWQDTRAV